LTDKEGKELETPAYSRLALRQRMTGDQNYD